MLFLCILRRSYSFSFLLLGDCTDILPMLKKLAFLEKILNGYTIIFLMYFGGCLARSLFKHFSSMFIENIVFSYNVFIWFWFPGNSDLIEVFPPLQFPRLVYI
jgi:hypothetical protein